VTTLVVVLIRDIVPFSVLKWPLWGAIACIIADMDVVLVTLLWRYVPHFGDIWNYHRLDGYMDTYYYCFEVYVAQRWQALPRWTATLLFLDRLVGFGLYETTNIRVFLFFFPNIFENFFLFYAVLLQYFPRYDLTPRRLVGWLIVVTIPKMVQEYALHYARWLDNVVAVDVVSNVSHAIIDWFRDRLSYVAFAFAG
jgi:hypothetical protein